MELTDILGELNKDNSNLVAFSETSNGEINDWIPTLIPVFDYNLVGGIPASGQVSELVGKPSSGKAVENGTLIPTPTGEIPIEKVNVGDYVFDRHGKPTKVIGVFPQGLKEAYKVTFSDNRTLVVNNEHLWSVLTSRNMLKTIKTQEMIDKGVSYQSKTKFGKSYRYTIPNNDWVMFNSPNKELSIDPYVIGVLLGDGCLKERQLTISSNDPFVVNKVAKLLPYACQAVKRSAKNYSWTFALDTPKLNDHNIKILNVLTKDIISASGLATEKAKDKFIPDSYKYASKEDRLKLLQGLLDTDGSSDKASCTASFSTVSPQLAKDVANLARSLGYQVYTSMYDRSKDNKSNEYYLGFHSTSEELAKLFTLPRKKETMLRNAKQKRAHKGTTITSIEKLNKQVPMTCLMVDNPEHLYLVGDYIVTHNTTATAAFMKSAIKMGAAIIYFDVEGTQHASRLAELGVDPSKVLTYAPTREKDGSIKELSIETIGETIIKVLAQVHKADPDRHVIFIWDSIAMSNSEMQATNELGQALVGQQAKALATVGRKIQVNLNMNNGALIALNQARDDFNAPNPKYASLKTVGGKGWEHLLSSRITLAQSGKIFAKSSDKEPIGTETRVKVVKSKVGDNWGSDFKMDILGAYGYDFEYNLVTSAQDNGLVTKGNFPKYVDQNGEEHKARNLYDLVQWFKDPENQLIRDELWQRLLLTYFPKCYPPLFNTSLFMHEDDFSMIKGLRGYYIKQQQNLDPQRQDYNYKHFMNAYNSGKLPKDIADEVKTALEG